MDNFFDFVSVEIFLLSCAPGLSGVNMLCFGVVAVLAPIRI